MSNRISVAEASRFLGVSVPTLRRMLAERRLPFYRLGRRVLLDTDDLTAALQSARVAPESESERRAA